jgi:toxin ParE1/3/4
VTFGYFVRPKADRDIDDIADELSERASLEVGLHFLANTYKTLTLLVSHPEMGWPCRSQNRQLPNVRVFQVGKPFEKYLIFYQALGERLEVLRVLHGAQDLEQILSTEGAF